MREGKWLTFFPQWMKADGSIGLKGLHMTTTPMVAAFAKEHFNCSRVKGAELGHTPAGFNAAHWSMRLFPDEVLSQFTLPGQKLSRLTLSYLEDTRWYKANWTDSDPLPWSHPKKRGCQIAEQSCYQVVSDLKSQYVPSQHKVIELTYMY